MPLLRPMTAIYLLRGDKILLLHREGSQVADQKWVGAAGGHMEAQEFDDPQACVLRELREELSLNEDALEGLALRYITLRQAGAEIRQNFYFFARLRDGACPPSSNEGTLRWWALGELHGMDMPFSARCMLEHYLHTGRYDEALYGGVADGDGVIFTKM